MANRQSTKFTAKAKPSIVIDNESGAEVKSKPSNAWSRVFEAVDEALHDQGAPSKTRVFCAYVLGFAASCLSGFLMAKVIDMIVIGALLLSGSALFAMLVWVMGLVIAIYAGMHAFSAGFGYVLSDVCTSHIAHARGVKNTVVGWFTPNKEQAHA